MLVDLAAHIYGLGMLGSLWTEIDLFVFLLGNTKNHGSLN